MPRSLAVETEASTLVADGVHAAGDAHPPQLGHDARRRRRRWRVHRLEGVVGEHVLQVRHEQFLVLLFMVEAEDQVLFEARQLLPRGAVSI